jgi:DNA replication protein DnaC
VTVRRQTAIIHENRVTVQGRHPRRCHEVQDLLSLGSEHCLCRHEQGFEASGREWRQRCGQLFWPRSGETSDRPAFTTSSTFKSLHEGFCDGVCRIPEDRDFSNSRYEVPQYLELFASEVDREDGDSGNISARVGQTVHKSRSDRITNGEHDYRDVFRSRERGLRRGRAQCRYHQGLSPKKIKLSRFNDDFGRGRALILCGTPGTGKTYCAAAAAGYIHRQNPKAIERLFWKASTLRASLMNLDRRGAIMDSLITSPFLVLDDLGMEFTRDGDFFEATLDAVVDEREANMRPLIITSNLTPERLAAKLGPRAWDRLSGDWGTIKTIVGPSARKSLQSPRPDERA